MNAENLLMGTTIGTDPEVICSLTDRRPGKPQNQMLPAAFLLTRYRQVMGDNNPFVQFGEMVYPDGTFKSIVVKSLSGTIFADGASLELNPYPHNAVSAVVGNMAGLMRCCSHILEASKTQVTNVSMEITPAMDFDLKMLDIWNDPNIAIFGCDPDKSIWPRKICPSNIDASKHPTRYFGGHVHVGLKTLLDELGEKPESIKLWLFDNMDVVRNLTLIFDATCGQIGLLFDDVVKEPASKRRMVYGQPGVYRPQDHGLEYRSLSNSWLLSIKRAEEMLTWAKRVPYLLMANVHVPLADESENIVNALLSGSVEYATKNLYKVAEIVNGEFGYEFMDVEEILNVANRSVKTWQTEWNV